MPVRSVCDGARSTYCRTIETHHATRGVNGMFPWIYARCFAHFHTSITAYTIISVNVDAEYR